MTCHLCAKSNCIGECEPKVQRTLASMLQPDAYLPNGEVNPKYLQPEHQAPVGYAVTSKLGSMCVFNSTEVKKGDVVYARPPVREPRSHDFAYWWFEHGSGITPLEGEDQEQHAFRVASEAWQAAVRAVTKP